ncbi:50S ribosomal protein L11 methyltransferase [Reinekea blandensis]|uniref:Ribosomal protein L11 methyltransferase n=1 Tax=Reinekea blandensis MED297 TaxID=314283 RepID=A4BFT6_9GAMM|nr:50S ribosomal protein L11 methyltransferase [Reinekea blandensis]EAR08954.1 ribosomal protein L11 methyltransferase [Reinekea sp. MED297] [Reinekea blandensis MED297]
MPWLQIRIPTVPEHTETLEDALLVAGCQAVTLLDTADKPVFEPIRGTTPLWEHTTVQGLFEHSVSADALVQEITQLAESEHLNIGDISTEILEDKDWEREWMDNFQPIPCGDRLCIVPSWLEVSSDHEVNLRLDPGLAFGTGTHPTTFLCLRWLSALETPPKQVLDFGCGSGILGLASLLLGANHMDGIDIDPQAITATRNNAELNQISPDRYRVTTDTSVLDDQYDLVLANILAGTLCDLKDSIIERLSPNGHLVLSGILEHQAAEVQRAYDAQIAFSEPEVQDGWVCLSGKRRQ